MDLILHNKFNANDENGNPILIWQFIDNVGNYYCTQTDINTDELTAKNVFLDDNSPLGLS